MSYVWDVNPTATAIAVAWNSLVQAGKSTLAHIGAYLDSDFNAFWFPASPATPANLAQSAGASLIGMFATHYALGEIVLAQEAANGQDSSGHPWAIPQPGGGYLPGIPPGQLLIPALDANNNPTGAGTIVAQVLTSVAITPATATLAGGGTQAFTAAALDQFGNPMQVAQTFTWSAASGSIDQNGNYTAPAGPATDTVTVAAGSVSAIADVTITG